MNAAVGMFFHCSDAHPCIASEPGLPYTKLRAMWEGGGASAAVIVTLPVLVRNAARFQPPVLAPWSRPCMERPARCGWLRVGP